MPLEPSDKVYYFRVEFRARFRFLLAYVDVRPLDLKVADVRKRDVIKTT